MHVDSSTVTVNGKTYTRHLLRESYRENGKVKHRTVANISKASPEEIEAIRLALRYKEDLGQLGSLKQEVTLRQRRLDYRSKRLPDTVRRYPANAFRNMAKSDRSTSLSSSRSQAANSSPPLSLASESRWWALASPGSVPGPSRYRAGSG